jgi:hypothetical protein
MTYHVKIKTKQGGCWEIGVLEIKQIEKEMQSFLREIKETYLSHEVFRFTLKEEFKGKYLESILSGATEEQLYNIEKLNVE